MPKATSSTAATVRWSNLYDRRFSRARTEDRGGTEIMLKSAARKALWVIKGMALFGGAVVTLALVFGVASVAFGDDGDNFVLGQNNVATALTKLTANRDGVAMQVKNT